MSDDYPRMMYRKGGTDEIFGLNCQTQIAESAEEEDYLTKAGGWARTPFEAHGVEAPKPDPIEEAPPESDEKLSLLDEIDQLRRDLSDLRDKLAAAEKERDESNKLLAEATKPAEPPKAKETLGIKQTK